MSHLIERVLNVALTAAAVCIAGTLLYRELRPPAPVMLDRGPLRATRFREWEEGVALGQVSGNARSALQVLVLSDLECPGCRQFHELTTTMQREDSLTLALRVIPFSLPQHRFAAPAARLLACAREAGHFDGMLNALFAGQDSLGLKDWTQYAEVAGWHAGVAADGCARSNAPVKFLDDARAFGDRIGLQSTPTVVINGFRLNRVPTRAELVDARDRVRAGRPPFEDSKAQ